MLYYKMTSTSRHGNKWTTTEILALQREYELLELSIPEIADRHKRSVMSILCKLECEGFIEKDEVNNQMIGIPVVGDFNVCAEECCEDDAVSEVDKLTERVWNLETSVTDIKGMVKSMFDTLVVQQKQTKRDPLRKYSR
jgi:hypothetical protein